jgi:thioredoxin 1
MEKVSKIRKLVLASLVGLLFGFSGAVKAESSLVKEAEDMVELCRWAREATEQKELVVFDFYSKQCGPCLFMSPIIESLALEMKGRVRFFKVSADNEKFTPLWQALHITRLPWFVIRKDGLNSGEIVGARNKEDFQAEIIKFLGS